MVKTISRKFRVTELNYHMLVEATLCEVINHPYIPYFFNFLRIHFVKRISVSVNRFFPKFKSFIFIGLSNLPEEIVPR